MRRERAVLMALDGRVFEQEVREETESLNLIRSVCSSEGL
jgi:hypothetical protein